MIVERRFLIRSPALFGPDQGFSFVNIAGKAKDPQDRIYEASWGEHNGV